MYYEQCNSNSKMRTYDNIPDAALRKKCQSIAEPTITHCSLQDFARFICLPIKRFRLLATTDGPVTDP
jgi:hypothetical protein